MRHLRIVMALPVMVIVLAAVMVATVLAAPGEQWTQLVPAGTAPDPRGAHSAVYDAGSNTMVVFGGRGGPTDVIYNDARRLIDANGDASPQWQPVNLSGASPTPRWIHKAVYDSDTDRMIVHGGGLGRSSPCSNET